ncbi:hypothetical protein DAPPUDRAFT_106230 [Daphnia pulex]|uniref:Uncharacterized protein n=1 Tax=Daphnia pulex TaxID=6669 RepID=E9GSZ4_DAPPU|nr:hypothetical protein DAPPUDRAFT_106230 [Daphnia pulex]|eukprot:EFX77360.1 hypothetical protein DAPPUDRAFT_106230 [Daphnia pulex]
MKEKSKESEKSPALSDTVTRIPKVRRKIRPRRLISSSSSKSSSDKPLSAAADYHENSPAESEVEDGKTDSPRPTHARCASYVFPFSALILPISIKKRLHVLKEKCKTEKKDAFPIDRGFIEDLRALKVLNEGKRKGE